MIRRLIQEVVSACYKAAGGAVIVEGADLLHQVWHIVVHH